MAFKQRTKADVASKSTLRGKDGKRKLGTKIRFKDGEETVLLNPSGKGAKYARELKERTKFTNSGDAKVNKKTGEAVRLTDLEASYRGGYLRAMKDSANAYKATQNKGDKK